MPDVRPRLEHDLAMNPKDRKARPGSPRCRRSPAPSDMRERPRAAPAGKPIASPSEAAEDRRADPARRRGREQPGLAEALDHGEEDRRQKDAEERHAQHAAEHRDPQRPPHLGPGPRGDDQRDHTEDERERRHQDRPQPQPARLLRRLEDAAGPARAVCLAYSTIRMAFLHASPTSTTSPICTKMLTSRCVYSTPATEQSRHKRHDQDDRQRQRPALVQGGQGQEDADDCQRRRRRSRCCPPGSARTSARSTRLSSTAAGSRRPGRRSSAMASPVLTPAARCR